MSWKSKTASLNDTVDGRNPAPPGMQKTLWTGARCLPSTVSPWHHLLAVEESRKIWDLIAFNLRSLFWPRMSCAVHPRIYRHGPIALSRWSGRQWQQAVARDTLLLTVGETHHALLDQAAQIDIKNWSCQLNRMCCIETLAVHFCTWYPLISMI